MPSNIITFLAPKGGAGRTTAVMALASALIERKEFPPVVIDATPEARCSHGRQTTLGLWHQQMMRCGVKRDGLFLHRAASSQELNKVINAELGQRLPSFSTILIDTGGRLDDVALTAAARSDLLVAPFMDALTAHRISEALGGVERGEAPLYGLKCGDACDDAEHRAASAAFTAGRLFLHGIPPSPQLANISTEGRLLSIHIKLICDHAHYSSSDPARAPVRNFMKVKSKIDQLLDEIGLALEGYELQRRTPVTPRPPLPLRDLGRLLPT